MKVLFVCLGNICRSPLAEAIFVHKVKEKKLGHQLSGDSCGTADYHVGQSPDPRTIRNAAKNGVLMHHSCRQLTTADLQNFDMILAMDKSNHSNIMRLPEASANKYKIFMMRDFDPNGKGDVPDPYYGNEQDFQEVFDILERAMEGLLLAIATREKSSGI